MICVADEISLLAHQEQRLHQSLDNLRGQRTLVKEQPNLLQIDGAGKNCCYGRIEGAQSHKNCWQMRKSWEKFYCRAAVSAGCVRDK